MTYKNLILLTFLSISFCITRSQNITGSGGKMGISFQFGTHLQRIGLMYQIYYFNSHIQINHGTTIHYNRKSFGPEIPGFEIQLHLGGQYHWGDETNKKPYFLSEYTLITSNPYSVGYMYLIFLNKVKTSQPAGVVFFNINRFGFVFENDFLGIWKGYEDKYRTGALAFTLALDSLQLGIQTTLWTGKSIEGQKIKNDTYPSKHGYRDLSNATYGKKSHGILALRLNYHFKYKQTLRAETGIDAEQIRHALQNKLFHDFLLTKLNPRVDNPHYPMLQENGSPYLFKDNQKIRPVKGYFQFGVNPGMFY